MQLADLLSGTRGNIVGLVRGGTSTVGEIASSLHLTPNNVRAHLVALERDGVIEIAGRKSGTRKPSHVYQLTSAAETLYARAYEPVMIEFVRVLTGQGGELTPAFEEVGRRMAAALGPMEGWPIQKKLETVAAALRNLGATPVLVMGDGTITLTSRQCPLGSLVATCPQACAIGLSLISTATGLKVVENCQHGARPQCAFTVSLQQP